MHAICTDQVIGCDDVDKRKVGGQKVNIVAVCTSGVCICIVGYRRDVSLSERKTSPK